MKRYQQILSEVTGEKAHRDAVARGLKYKGFGYWADNTGKTAFKTENDELVPVEADVASEKAGKPGMERDGFPGGGPEDVPDMSTSAQMQQTRKAAGLADFQVGSGVTGAPEPGEELVPQDLDWEPGPDGSTCVDSDEPAAVVPEDSFVNKTNNMKWKAGPDGTTYTNIDYGKLIQDMRENRLDVFMNRLKMMEAMPHPVKADEDA